MWNIINKSKKAKQSDEAISIKTFEDYYRDKFSGSSHTSAKMEGMKVKVKNKYEELSSRAKDGVINQCNMFSEYKVKKYIRSLKNNLAAGYDGISAEHLKYAISTRIPLMLSSMFSACLKYGILPNQFNNGILVPILKKATLDPGVPTSYRPVTVSCVISKILEMFILDQSNYYGAPLGTSCAPDNTSCAQDSKLCAQDNKLCSQDNKSCAQDSKLYVGDNKLCAQDNKSCAIMRTR